MLPKSRKQSITLVQLKYVQGSQQDEALQPTASIVVDELIHNEVGSCGLWQGSLVILAILSTAGASSFPIFSDTVPMHRCHMGTAWEEAFTRSNRSFDQIVEFTSGLKPSAENQMAIGCNHYSGDWLDNSTVPSVIPESMVIPPISNLSNETVPCRWGYVYKYHSYQYHSGIVAEFNLVCDKRWLVPIGTSTFMIGMTLGYFICGFWCSRFGFKNGLIVFSFMELICTIASSLVNDFWWYTLLRALVAVGSYGKLSSFNLILLEITLAKYRSFISSIYLLGFNFTARALQAMFAFLIPYWRWMSLASSFHCFFVFIYFFVIPESPRWLLGQGRTLEAIKVLQYGSKVNKLHTKDAQPSKVLKMLADQEARRPSLVSILSDSIDPKVHRVIRPPVKSSKQLIVELFMDSKYRRHTVVSTAIFAMYSLSFVNVVQYTRMVRENVILVAFLNGAVSIPGIAIAVVLYRLIRYRRLPLVIVHVMCTLVLAIGGLYTMIALPEEDIVLTLTVNAGLLFYATIQCMLFIYIPELYPPNLRSQAFGISAGLGRITAALCLYVNEMDYTFRHASPILVYTVTTLTSGGLLLLLSDTTGEESSPECQENKDDTDRFEFDNKTSRL